MSTDKNVREALEIGRSYMHGDMHWGDEDHDLRCAKVHDAIASLDAPPAPAPLPPHPSNASTPAPCGPYGKPQCDMCAAGEYRLCRWLPVPAPLTDERPVAWRVDTMAGTGGPPSYCYYHDAEPELDSSKWTVEALYLRAASAPVDGAVAETPASASTSAPALPPPGSPEASAMLDSLLAEYNWPANSKNAARAGWEAARRWLAEPNGKSAPDPYALSRAATKEEHDALLAAAGKSPWPPTEPA